MEALPRKKVGRPRSPSSLSVAERMRRYRARLRAQGIRLRAVHEVDALVAVVHFPGDTFLTPGEQEVIRRFCGRFRRLARLPRAVAVFGSRARGTADERSDLDVAVLFDGGRDPALESAVSEIALDARKPFRSGRYGIFLRPVPFYGDEAGTLPAALREDLEVVWKRPK